MSTPKQEETKSKEGLKKQHIENGKDSAEKKQCVSASMHTCSVHRHKTAKKERREEKGGRRRGGEGGGGERRRGNRGGDQL